MKTPLKDHVLLYDDGCPMCALYTRGFVQAGMLAPEGRVAYANRPHDCVAYLDAARACDEIALIDTKAKTVTYGIDSLTKILSHRFPMLGALLRRKPVVKVLQVLYALISYNRKVVVPGDQFEGAQACAPSFSLRYRLLYVLLTWLVTSYLLSRYTVLLMPFVPASSFVREFVICAGQLVFQGALVWWLRRDRVIHYLGNMMTVSLAGGLLLGLALLVATVATLPAWCYLPWFGLVVAAMFAEHTRRLHILEISYVASAGWVVYRLLVLVMIYYVL